MIVSKVMATTVSRVGPETTIPEIARRMGAEDIGALPVADDDRLVGIVTDRDIVLRAVARGGDVDRIAARDVMSPQVLYCFDDQAVTQVLRNMGENQVRRLPVLDRDKRLVGVVSLGELSRAAAQNAGRALKDISRPVHPAGNDPRPGRESQAETTPPAA